MQPLWSKLKYFDLPLFGTTLLLLVIGLSLQYSISLSGNNLTIFYRQLIFVVLGLAAYFLLSFYSYRHLAKMHRIIYPLLLLALVIVLVFSREVRGSTRWIDLGFVVFQPSEVAKLVVILGLGRWLYLQRGQINSWKSIIVTFIYAFIPAGLVILEPDLGSAIIIMGIWLGVLLVSPIKKRFIFSLAVLLIVLAGIGWQFVLKDYQKYRIEVFLDPQLDPHGRGYNVRQAMIAVGNGQLWGRGLGQGLQSQLRFLPERQTDFIFASASEEIGFLGSSVILALYVYLLFRILRVARSAPDDLALYLASGVLFMIFGMIVINIGMNVGLLPVTGIPLPFLSYGGNSLIVVLASLGMAQNISRQSKILRF